MTVVIDHLFDSEKSATLFQPIYDVRGDEFLVWAVEALTRGPAGTHFESAPILFDYVRLKGEEVRADRWCLSSAVARYAASGASARLSVYVLASTLERDPSFPLFVESVAAASAIDPSTLILELVEHAPYFDASRILRSLGDLRSLGVTVAIDDVGLGYGNFRAILDVRPEYLKIDRYFVAGVAGDALRQSLIRSAVQIANDFGALVVGEGLDDPADLAVMRDMGVPLIQGFLLGRPERQPDLAPIRAASTLAPQHPLFERSHP